MNKCSYLFNSDVFFYILVLSSSAVMENFYVPVLFGANDKFIKLVAQITVKKINKTIIYIYSFFFHL